MIFLPKGLLEEFKNIPTALSSKYMVLEMFERNTTSLEDQYSGQEKAGTTSLLLHTKHNM